MFIYLVKRSFKLMRMILSFSNLILKMWQKILHFLNQGIKNKCKQQINCTAEFPWNTISKCISQRLQSSNHCRICEERTAKNTANKLCTPKSIFRVRFSFSLEATFSWETILGAANFICDSSIQFAAIPIGFTFSDRSRRGCLVLRGSCWKGKIKLLQKFLS